MCTNNTMISFAMFTAITAVIFSLIVFRYFQLSKKSGDVKPPPMAAGAWPITGHLHLLAGAKEVPHKLFGSLASKYGPIFTLNLGSHQALVVNSAEMAKECFTTNDKAFGNRPKSLAVGILSFNYASLGFAEYGPYWRTLRKISVLELLSQNRLQMLAHVRTSEVKLLIKDLYNFWNEGKQSLEKVTVDLKPFIGNLTMNVVLRMIAGKRYSPGEKEGEYFKKTMRTYVVLLGTVVVGDVIPWLRWLDFRGYEKKMKKTAKEVDAIFGGWLDEHKEKMRSGQPVEPKDQVFMATLLARLNEQTEKDLACFDNETIVKATCSTIFAAGADTTTVTLTWAVALLVNHPHVLRKAQEEIDKHVGKDRLVEESDLKNLVYIFALLKETMRMYPPAPVITPHESIKDCIVGGCKVQKGTRLLVNIWKIHRDPKYWPQPDEYIPERFLTSHKEVDIWGQNFEYLPFSSGRRICLGISLAVQAMHLALATLIQAFDLESPTGGPIDMTETGDITNVKATPLDVLMSPRLSAKFYDETNW